MESPQKTHFEIVKSRERDPSSLPPADLKGQVERESLSTFHETVSLPLSLILSVCLFMTLLSEERTKIFKFYEQVKNRKRKEKSGMVS